jgi:cysteine-rich repeat protein
MKWLYGLFLACLLCGPQVRAATLDCTLPVDNVARGVELCEELRQQLRVRSSEWDNDICATQFLRIGMFEVNRRSAVKEAKATVAGQVGEAVNAFQDTWAAPDRAVCGDDVLDTEAPFNEACDDGNTDNGDGCSNACGVE